MSFDLRLLITSFVSSNQSEVWFLLSGPICILQSKKSDAWNISSAKSRIPMVYKIWVNGTFCFILIMLILF